MQSDQRTLTAIGLMIGVTLLSAADSVIVRMLTRDLHPFTIVFFRSLFGLLFVAPWILRDRKVLSSNYFLLHLLRAVLKMLSLAAFFSAIALVALADVTTIAFTTPVFLTIGAWIFLKEKPQLLRVLAVALSFVGVLIVLQPGQGTISNAILLALAGAVLTAVIQLILKVMSAKDSTETLVAWNLLATVPMAAIPLFWFWTAPSPDLYLLLALQGVVGALNMAFMTRAMSLVQASYLAPFEFLRLPAVALLGWLFFAEVPSGSTLAGAVIIFVSTVLLTSGGARRNKA